MKLNKLLLSAMLAVSLAACSSESTSNSTSEVETTEKNENRKEKVDAARAKNDERLKEKEAHKEATVGDTVTTDDGVLITLDKVEYWDSGNEFLKPDDGDEFILFTLTIQNDSGKKFSYNPLQFKLVNDNGQETDYDPVVPTTISSGSLMDGGSFTGTVGFQDMKDSSFTLNVYDQAFSSDVIATFTIKNDQIDSFSGTVTSSGSSSVDLSTDAAKVGRSVKASNGVTYTLLSVDYSNGEEYNQPADGNVFVHCKVRIENTSDKKVSYNLLDWSMTNSNGQTEDVDLTAFIDAEDMLDSGDLVPGGHVEGTLSFEEPSTGNLYLEVHEFAFSDDGVLASWIIER